MSIIKEFILPDHSNFCVYFLLHNERVVYVGRSVNLATRIQSHLYIGGKVFNRVFFIEAVSEEKMEALEVYYIRCFQPKYNYRYDRKFRKKKKKKVSKKNISKSTVVYNGEFLPVINDVTQYF